MVSLEHAVESRLPPAATAFLARLRAWWGRGRHDVATGGDAEEPLLLTRRVPGDDVPPLDRITIAEWLWGPGHHLPGGERHVLDLVKPFALTPAMSMVDVAAGLGGAARSVAATFGTYVTGLERDPELAERGMEMSVLQGMQKRAPITAYDPAKLELRAGLFDCVLGRQATYAVADKARFLEGLRSGLKDRGQLLLTDYVVEPKSADKPELAAWQKQQPYPPQLWTLKQYTECLSGLGFEIRVTEDTSDGYRRRIVAGWDQMLHTVDLHGLPRKHVAAILDEAERAVHAIAALESGSLQIYRLYALASKPKPAPKPKKAPAKKA